MKVWRDAPIVPFTSQEEPIQAIASVGDTLDCPISPCGCQMTAVGDLASVRKFLGVDQVWDDGYRGQGIVIGMVDTGILAEGRVPCACVPNVTGGWPENSWGTISLLYQHGNMTATDTLGMAPEATLYDIQIFDTPTIPGLLSNALAGFQWAITQYKETGQPHILSNSWGIYQESQAPDYATDRDNPFTRKVREAVRLGIVVLFAAGNCGSKACTVPGLCGEDFGPGKSIWGANGASQVMTVGAADQEAQYMLYSSPGPAALDKKKPDFCGVSQFEGYYHPIAADGGTSAACAITAGVVALLKQANPALDPHQLKKVLQSTAQQIGSEQGWNNYSGYGIIQAKKVYDRAVA